MGGKQQQQLLGVKGQRSLCCHFTYMNPTEDMVLTLLTFFLFFDILKKNSEIKECLQNLGLNKLNKCFMFGVMLEVC